MCERVQLLEKASRQFELDNERLAFKVSVFLGFIKSYLDKIGRLYQAKIICNILLIH